LSGFNETATWATSSQLWQLFVAMLLHCNIADEHTFFEKVWKLMADDIQYNFCKAVHIPNYQMPDNELRDHLFDKLSILFNKSGASIQDFNLPRKEHRTDFVEINHLVEEELSYDANTLLNESQILITQLNTEQLIAFHTIVDVVISEKMAFISFLDIEALAKLSYGMQ
jgi:hypothetical protein